MPLEQYCTLLKTFFKILPKEALTLIFEATNTNENKLKCLLIMYKHIPFVLSS